MSDNILNMSDQEIKEKYETAFKERVEQLDGGSTENDWKKSNAPGVIGEKCAIVYYEADPFAMASSGMNSAGMRAGLSKAGYSNVAGAISQYERLYGVYDESQRGKLELFADVLAAGSAVEGSGAAEERAGQQGLVDLHNRWLQGTQDSKGACGDRYTIDQKLDTAWQDYRAAELLEIVEEDIQKAGTIAKQASMECAENLKNARVMLQQAIDLFFEGASDPEAGMFNNFDANTLRGRAPINQYVEAAGPAQDIEQARQAAALGIPGAAEQVRDFELSEDAAQLRMLEQIGMTEGAPAIDYGRVGNATNLLITTDPPTSVPDYLRVGGEISQYDHILISDEARQSLKTPEFYGDISRPSPIPLGDIPHLYASFLVGLHNVLEQGLMQYLPTESEVAAFTGGADGSSAALFNKAQAILTYYDDPAKGTVGLAGKGFDSAPGLIGFIDNFCTPAVNKLPEGPLKQFLVSGGTSLLPTLKSLLDKIKRCAEDIKDAKDDFDDFIDDLRNNIPAAAEVLDNDVAEEAFNQAMANLGDTDLDDIGFGSLEDKKLFKEQCFLLAYAAKIAEFKNKKLEHVDDKFTAINSSGVTKRLPYCNIEDLEVNQTDFAAQSTYNASLQINGDSFGFINKLTQSPNYAALIDIPHHQLSALQPMIRLFKVEYNEEMDDNEHTDLETEVEMKFNSAFTQGELSDVFLGRKTRSAGVGLKEFEFTYDGSNPFSYKKSIKAKLVLHAATFQELFLERKGETTRIKDGSLRAGPDKNYRYIDLALKTFSKFTNNNSLAKKYQKIFDENANLAKLNFRLKAVVGWSLPKGDIPGLSADEKNKLKSVLSNSYVTLNLTPTIHNFAFDQTGAVTFEINYLAYIDDFFDDRGFNVFADPTGKVGWQRELRRMQMTRIRSKCSSAEEIQDLNQKYKDVVQKEVNDSLSSLMRTMIQKKKIYYINIDYEKIQNFIADGPYNAYEDYVISNSDDDIVLSDSDRDEVQQEIINDAFASYSQQLGGTDEQASEASLKAALFAASPQSNELSFFYLSDLIDVVLENIQLELEKLSEQYKKDQNKKDFTTTSDSNEDLIHIDDWNKRMADLEKYKKNLKRFRLLLGPVELAHHSNFEKGHPSVFVSFGDLPISVKYFLEWVAGKVLSKDEVFYSLSAFLNQLMNNLVTKFLNNNRCFYFDIKQKVRVNQATLTSYSAPEYGGLDEITYLLRRKAKAMKNLEYGGNPTKLNMADAVVQDHRGLNADGTIVNGDPDNLGPILNVSGRPNNKFSNYPPLSNEINYMVFYAARVSAHGSVPNREADSANGVFHYLLGRDRGLIKEINLQKTTSKGLAEVRFEQDGYDGLSQLRVVYDLDITSYANVNTYPGMYIYVPPAGFDPSFARLPPQTVDRNGRKVNFDLSQVGIGGYYMIIRSTHKFAMGEASSKISAKWVANLHNDFPPAEGGTGIESGEPDPSCQSTIDNRITEMEKP